MSSRPPGSALPHEDETHRAKRANSSVLTDLVAPATLGVGPSSEGNTYPRSSDDEKQNRTAGPLRRSGLGRLRLCARRRQDHHVLASHLHGCHRLDARAGGQVPGGPSRPADRHHRVSARRLRGAPARGHRGRRSSGYPERPRLPVSRVLREGLAGPGRSGRLRREHPAGRRRPVRASGPGGNGIRRAGIRRAGRVQHVRAVPQPGDVRGGRPGRIGAVGTVAGTRGDLGRVLRPAELGRDAERGRRPSSGSASTGSGGWTRSGTPSSSGTSPPSTAATS